MQYFGSYWLKCFGIFDLSSVVFFGINSMASYGLNSVVFLVKIYANVSVNCFFFFFFFFLVFIFYLNSVVISDPRRGCYMGLLTLIFIFFFFSFSFFFFFRHDFVRAISLELLLAETPN